MSCAACAVTVGVSTCRFAAVVLVLLFRLSHYPHLKQ